MMEQGNGVFVNIARYFTGRKNSITPLTSLARAALALARGLLFTMRQRQL